MFEVRPSDVGPLVVQNFTPGQGFDAHVREGDSAELRIVQQRVLIRAIERAGALSFRGEIFGFEPSFETEYSGLQIGQIVEFEERHIFSVSGP
jgi:hypothetical protein